MGSPIIAPATHSAPGLVVIITVAADAGETRVSERTVLTTACGCQGLWTELSANFCTELTSTLVNEYVKTFKGFHACVYFDFSRHG